MATGTPQSILGAVNRLLSFKLSSNIAIRRAYDDWFWKQFIADKIRASTVENQKLILEEHKNLGSEIASAKFVVATVSGKVRIQEGKWITKSKELPTRYDDKFALTYIDLSKSGLVTEAIDNLIGLQYLEALDLSNNPKLDDFACDMLARQFRYSKTLKEINLSFNPYISIYGLDVLFKIPSLKRLVASSTLASNHEQKELFKLSAEAEKDCEVIL